jgi:hypothetical protein
MFLLSFFSFFSFADDAIILPRTTHSGSQFIATLNSSQIPDEFNMG